MPLCCSVEKDTVNSLDSKLFTIIFILVSLKEEEYLLTKFICISLIKYSS